MPKQYFLQKAHKARPDLVKPWYQWSIKLDGIRAFWDGGVSRGRSDAPWAPGVKASGLWTLNAKPLYAPDWWLDQMPDYVADGELWAGPGNFQSVSSIVRRKIPDDRWALIRFMHHTDIQPVDFCKSRTINEPHCKLIMDGLVEDYFFMGSAQPSTPGNCYEYLKWEQVPEDHTWEALNLILDSLVSEGHEGIMVRNPRAEYSCGRTYDLLKLKPFSDADVQVIGVKSGKETDKGSKLLGLMGSLKCTHRNNTFYVSGFRESQRRLESLLEDVDAEAYARDHPGEDLPSYIQAKDFPNGCTITIKFRELTTYREVPKDPRFWRRLL